MAPALSRRRRRLLLAAGLAALFLSGAAAVTLVALRPKAPYEPGEKVKGLTADLSRSLPPDHPKVTFTDVTRQAGIRFRHFWGTRTAQLPEDMGSGAAWADYDNDGWQDLFVANEVGPLTLTPGEAATSPAQCALYHNNRDGTFTEVSAKAGIHCPPWAMGAQWGDYDNDGWPDLFITAYGENVLYHNNGNGTFTDVTNRAGVGGRRGFWTGAAWGDYDRDGCLDLYVTGYVKYTYPAELLDSAHTSGVLPAGINFNAFPPARNLLYHNNCNGTFSEVAARAGVLGETGRGLGAVWADLDDDGWPDLYVADDEDGNLLYRNRGDGTFENITDASHVPDYRGSMGLALGDWNGDGATDIFVTHWLAQENALFDNQLSRDRQARSEGPAAGPVRPDFVDEADRYGLGQIALDYVGWATFFVDYDNDGRLDLFVVNGSTNQQRDNPRLLVPMKSQLFWNRNNSEGFYDVSAVSGDYFQKAYVGRGAAYADYDNDGDLDVFVVNNGGPGILLRNDGGNRDHWLEVRLEGRKSNRMGFGTKLRLFVGGAAQFREVGGQAPYLSQNTTVQHFGLGTHTEADSLVVTWLSGICQVFTHVAANQILHIVEGEGGR